MPTQSPSPRPQVAYLLADAGITLWDSRKGCSIHARSMIRALAAEGADVTVYVMREGRGPRDPGIQVKPVRQRRATRWWWRQLVQGTAWRWLAPWRPAQAGAPNWITAVGWLLWHRDFARKVAQDLQGRPPDLVYARHAWLAWPYGRLHRRFDAPMILEVNALFTIEKADRDELAFPRLTRWIERRVLRAADRIWPVSAELAQQATALGADPARVEVTPNAVDPELFQAGDELVAPTDGPFVIGSVGSMRAYHGLETLLEAAVRLRDQIPGLRLLLIGGGPRLEAIRAQAEALGLAGCVELTGVIPHEQVPLRLRECAVAVAPNEGPVNQYNCPMKLFEYMAMKIPIVASRWGDIPNILEEGQTALLHDPGDPDSLAEALLAVQRDPAAARCRAEAAQALVASHSWRAVARRALALVRT